jgi:hypothetical protein
MAAIAAGPVRAEAGPPQLRDALLRAYPAHLARIEGNTLFWRDGTSMPLDDNEGEKSMSDWLEKPDIADMFRYPYPAGEEPRPPNENSDPGRARPRAFFEKMYGDCQKGGIDSSLVEIAWLPKTAAQRLKVTRINGVAEKLTAISEALEKLPSSFHRYLKPPASTFNCRVIAGTSRVSAHGYGIAIDVAVPFADYWRWPLPSAGASHMWRNRIPREIVDIFERHGFIWGGRWHHFDTMHFEYRPEFFVTEPPAAGKKSPGD